MTIFEKISRLLEKLNQKNAIKMNINNLNDLITRELNHWNPGDGNAPAQPVKGTVNVMPIWPKTPPGDPGEYVIVMQFNGWSIELCADGTWGFRDTAQEAAQQVAIKEEVKNEKN